MNQVTIPIPLLSGDEATEVQVTVGGRVTLLKYRVVLFRFDRSRDAETRSDQLRAFVHEYDPAWTLVQIGSPSGNAVPLTFRQQSSHGREAGPSEGEAGTS
jgi:hypothetical protein